MADQHKKKISKSVNILNIEYYLFSITFQTEHYLFGIKNKLKYFFKLRTLALSLS